MMYCLRGTDHQKFCLFSTETTNRGPSTYSISYLHLDTFVKMFSVQVWRNRQMQRPSCGGLTLYVPYIIYMHNYTYIWMYIYYIYQRNYICTESLYVMSTNNCQIFFILYVQFNQKYMQVINWSAVLWAFFLRKIIYRILQEKWLTHEFICDFFLFSLFPLCISST